ncbi:hypothetical protein, partial [Microbacterium natoriense]|uniref:hypothetical protein n=1 Tax=Microbacterium natoriense TaxID=284570 RepID=UPI0031DB813C
MVLFERFPFMDCPQLHVQIPDAPMMCPEGNYITNCGRMPTLHAQALGLRLRAGFPLIFRKN